MDENEFLRLKIGTVVGNRNSRFFVIYDDDHMGTAHLGKERTVYAASSIEKGSAETIRIDSANAQFWDIAGYMKKEDLEELLYK